MTSRRCRSVLFAASAVFSGLALIAACGDDSGSSGSGKVLKVYSGRHYGIERAYELFEQQTGITVKFLNGDDAELRERIAAEGADTEADVYLTVDAGNLAAAADQGIFQPLDSEVLQRVIPAQLRDPDNLWFGLAVRYRTIVYTANEAWLPADEVPTTYEELADPKWKGRLCLRRSVDAYQQSLVASMIAADGYDATLETVRGWVDNAQILPNDVILIDTIAAGGCDVGIANHYYLARELAENPDLPVKLVWAEQDGRGVHVNVSGGGVTKYADDPELARQFLE
ncbi:MAG TPA: extracellular solute-binding protein, partial [Ilumatobacteraceae bacterium]|nr:extracellular solute-binding protein [Ilumatobacteraceae bacterium]